MENEQQTVPLENHQEENVQKKENIFIRFFEKHTRITIFLFLIWPIFIFLISKVSLLKVQSDTFILLSSVPVLLLIITNYKGKRSEVAFGVFIFFSGILISLLLVGFGFCLLLALDH
jgi:hypothetical protein